MAGSIRRERLDHVIVVNETGLSRIVTRYLEYCHQSRTHLSLAKDSPHPRPIAPPTLGPVAWRSLKSAASTIATTAARRSHTPLLGQAVDCESVGARLRARNGDSQS